jgi:integrase
LKGGDKMPYVYPIKNRKKIEDMRKILAYNSSRDELLFLLGINTAFRISDLLRLKFSDLYDQKGRPIQKLYAYKEKKTGKLKSLPMPAKVEKALKEYVKAFPDWQPDDPIFQSRKKDGSKGSGAISRQQAQRILIAAAESAGIKDPIGTHTLRKTFAYMLYKETGNIALVMKLLNHDSQSDTLRYIGIEQEEMDAAVLNLNLG